MLAICRNKKMDFSKLKKSTLFNLPTLGTLERAVEPSAGCFARPPKIHHFYLGPLDGFGN